MGIICNEPLSEWKLVPSEFQKDIVDIENLQRDLRLASGYLRVSLDSKNPTV